MALNRIDYPAQLNTQADFSAHAELIESRYLDQTAHPIQVRDGVIPQGVVLQIGGVLYRADSDETITGTASDYVRITTDGSTATAAYVADLTGVAWNAQYNGYYDSQSPARLYLFNEKLAWLNDDVETIRTRYVEVDSVGDAGVPRDLRVGRDVIATQDFVKAGRTGGHAGVGANTSSGGGAVGNSAGASAGGAVGNGASAGNGGAVGFNASATSGGAAGSGASTSSGGAVGIGTSSTLGGAVGNGASATTGFSGGVNATANNNNEFSLFNYFRGIRFAPTTSQSTVRSYFNQILTSGGISIGAFGSYGNEPVVGSSPVIIRISRNSSANTEFYNIAGDIILTCGDSSDQIGRSLVVAFADPDGTVNT